MNSCKHFTVAILCFLLVYMPVMADPQATGQQAGQINALIPAATRNSQAATVKEELDWNDLLKTEHSGRVRAGLTDGSGAVQCRHQFDSRRCRANGGDH
jgi:hypothetical protein